MMREVFVPMSHRNGEAQVNSGHALAKIRGTLTKCPFFVMSLPYSDIFYLYICGCECAEGFPALTQRQNKPYKCLTTLVSNCPLPGGRSQGLGDHFKWRFRISHLRSQKLTAEFIRKLFII